MDKRRLVSLQLADWMMLYPWHYTTQLQAVIEHLENAPADEAKLVNVMLSKFTKRPEVEFLSRFLFDFFRSERWFRNSLAINETCLQRLINSHYLYPQLPKLDTIGELTDFLNITETQLDSYAQIYQSQELDYARTNKFKHYFYQLHEKSNQGYRLIESPKNKLKSIQRTILRDILAVAEIHPAAHGFVRGKSCQTHAALHTNKPVVYHFDLADCFQSISWPQVYSVFRNLGYPKMVAQYLTHLTTHKCFIPTNIACRLTVQQQKMLAQRHLPQGAPTSPTISNLVLQKFDKRLTGFANVRGLIYSRYADDMILSGQPQNWQRLQSIIAKICEEEGFKLNQRKSNFRTKAQRQTVTGIVVNDICNIDRRYYDTLKSELNNCVKLGLASQNRKGHRHYRSYLLGKVTYVTSINANKGKKLMNLYHQIQD